tara:strand:+ start:1377 stop:1595 length:219 start_codon:yes stop_codon:yes gene_type:complete
MKTAVEWLTDGLGFKTQHRVINLAYKDLREKALKMEKQQAVDFAYVIANDLACGVLSKKAIKDRYNEFFKSE